MSIVEQQIAPLEWGDYLRRDEFLRRWEAMPEVKKAELIGGIVYMPSPVSIDHGEMTARVNYWLYHYAAHTAGCAVGNDATWLMQHDAPQPDVHLRVLPECGGHSRLSGRYSQGAPELIVEVCHSSTSYDLHQKKDLYSSSGVDEYVAVILAEKQVHWHRLKKSGYEIVPSSLAGVIQSVVFPGLWLHVSGMLAGDVPQIMETLNRGLESPEHGDFVSRLAARRVT